jgi:uncharacterized membrane protein YjjP (DUF1212 family)
MFSWIKNRNIVVNVILVTVVVTLCIVVASMVGSLLHALLDPAVDNKDIFAIIGPAFSTIIGAFVGLLGGLSITRKPTDDPSAEQNE